MKLELKLAALVHVAVKLKPNEEELDLSHVLESAGLAVGHCGADALPKLKLANGFVGAEVFFLQDCGQTRSVQRTSKVRGTPSRRTR